MLLVVAACSATDATPSGEASAAATARTVTDPTGHEVTIPGDPQRVFGMYTTDTDYAIVLDLALAPQQSIRQGSVGLPTFLPQDKLAGIEPLVNYPDAQWEKMAALAPDVIVNGLGYEGGPDQAKMAAIAPTFTYDGFDGDWRDDLDAMATAFGREEQAAAFKERVQSRTAEVKAKVDGLPEKPVFAYGYANEDGSGGFYGSAPTALPPLIFSEVGIGSSSAVGADEPWYEIAGESIPKLADVDVLMLAVETDSDPEKTLEQVRKDPIWSKLPAVQEGRVVTVNNELSYASPHAHLTLLDDVEQHLGLL